MRDVGRIRVTGCARVAEHTRVAGRARIAQHTRIAGQARLQNARETGRKRKCS